MNPEEIFKQAQQALLAAVKNGEVGGGGRGAGFSLIQLSIILTVGALILAATLPGGAGDDVEKARITMERMGKIEAATRQFMAVNQRRPYPSDITAGFGAAAYGVELAVPTDYSVIPTTHFTTAATAVSFTRTVDTTALTGGTTSGLAKNWLVSGTGIQTSSSNLTWVQGITSSTALTMNRTASASGTSSLNFRNPLVAGGVPTKTLGLPDEVGIDGYGRRMVYMVDSRTTVSSGCLALQSNNLQGALALSNSSTFATGTYDYAMAALLSYGKDGQGAVGIQGAALSSRIKTGNTDAATLNNAFYNGSQVTSFTATGLVNTLATATFDDIVWVDKNSKNICAYGDDVKSFRDFRVDGGGSGSASASAAFGDVNGDGYQDLIYGIAQQNLVRVIFGKKNNWPKPNTAYTSSGVDGNTGFTITKGTENVSGFGTNVSVGDVNGDGYDDVIAGGVPTATTDNAYAVLFGKSAWASSVSISSLSGSTGFLIKNLNNSVTSHVSVGDVNGDGYDDIALPFDASGSSDWAQGVIYGKSSSWSNITLNTAFLDGANGVYFNVATPNTTNGDVSYGSAAASTLGRRLSAICNVNGDAYQDLVLPGVLTGSATITPQRFYLKVGAASWAHSSGLIDPSAAVMLSFNTSTANPAPYDVKAMECRDINSDGYDDALIYLKNNSTSQEYVYSYFGRSSPATSDLDANYDIQFDLTASAPSWQDAAIIPQIAFGDVNNDGKADIILSRRGDDPYFSISGTTFIVETTATGTQRSNAGMSYVLYQPASWGTTPSLEKDFFGDYTFDGTGGIKIMGAVASDSMIIQGAADMNKDSKTDLILSSGVNPTGGYFVFGKSSWPGAYDLNCTRDKSGAHCPTQIIRQ
ncbi:MAG: FG-GAP repeat protein [Alphaproteobacteria bacterium]|nr:FG-GAP repeat protein [Alphaproteobacteria bacterium]